MRNWTLAVQLFGDLERQRLEHDTVSVNSVLNAASQQRRYSKNLLEQLTFLLCLRLFGHFFRFPIVALLNGSLPIVNFSFFFGEGQITENPGKMQTWWSIQQPAVQ